MSRIMAEEQYTAWKVYIFGVFLVRFFPHSDWIVEISPYLSVFSTNEGKYGPEKLRMRTLFSYWYSWMLVWCLHHCAWLVNFSWSESYSEPCQRSKMKRFANPLPSSPPPLPPTPANNVNYFCKTFHHSCLTGFWMRLCRLFRKKEITMLHIS